MNETTFLYAADLRKAIQKTDDIIEKLERLVYAPPTTCPYFVQIDNKIKLSVDRDCLEVLLKHYEDKKQELEEKFSNLWEK